MRTFLAVVWVLVFFQFIPFVGSSQENKLFSGKFEGTSFPQLVKYIEANSVYRIYYEPQQLDSFTVNLSANNLSLASLLQKIFENTNFRFATDADSHVYITRAVKIQTELPPGLFDSNKTSTDKSPEWNPEAPVLSGATQDRLKIAAENKLYELGIKTSRPLTGNATIAGYVKDIRSGEAIGGATVYTDTPYRSVNTDQYGYYTLNLSKGRHIVHISSAGMKETHRQVQLYSDGKLDIELQEYIASLKTVIVSAEKNSNTRNLQMGTTRLSIKNIRQVPVIFGETDILKVVLALPGVTSTGEASNGFNVRGGSVDQNLILLSDATVYNPNHLFGFFSAFNADVVKGVELYKATIPEKFGGRLSSVLDIALQDGNTKKWSGNAGIGPLTSKFSIGGPLKKEKTTLMVGARTTYSNWLMKFIPDDEYKNSKANFYDANLRIAHTVNQKNSIYLTGYISHDKFSLNVDTTYQYGNMNGNIKWKHNFSNNFSNVLTLGADQYNYSVSGDHNPVTASRLSFRINQLFLRSDFNYTLNNKHQLNFGLNVLKYKLHPGDYEPVGSQSLVLKKELAPEQALETALYIGDKYSLSSKFSVTAGLRYSIFNYFGPQEVRSYVPGLPRDSSSKTGTTVYDKSSIIKTWQAPEIRIGMRYAFNENSSVKLSFNTMQQYIHMLSNTVSISPTDIWKLSDTYIKPQQGAQVSVGYYQNFLSGNIETSVEFYYKKMLNFLDYKSGAHLLMNEHIETDVISTRGKAYGVELLLKKTAGKLNGWISYTYSRTLLQQNDPLAGEKINRGEYYPASFDKPHNANLIGNYRISHRFSVSLNIVYSTGRPITLPIGVFTMGGSSSLLYSDRNKYRIPDYFRADLSCTLEGNHKVKQKLHNSWSFGVYNLTARENPYSVYFTQESGQIKGYQLSIFGTAIPFVTYNIKF
jgi:hypothetical protein